MTLAGIQRPEGEEEEAPDRTHDRSTAHLRIDYNTPLLNLVGVERLARTDLYNC